MGTWNYRIIKQVIDDEVTYSIREVYYADASQEEAEFWVSDSDTDLVSETITGLWDIYEMLGEAFERDVLLETEDGELVAVDDCAEDEEADEEADEEEELDDEE
jgi:hypothetical protein